MSTSLMYWNEKLARTQLRKVSFEFDITGAGTVAPLVAGAPVLTAFGAIASQNAINDFLGTTNEFLLAAFDATAMGADAMAVIVDMGGQVEKLAYATARCFSGTAGATRVEVCVQGGSLTASTLETAAAKGADGNLAMKINWGNTPDFDGLTDGTIIVDFYYVSK